MEDVYTRNHILQFIDRFTLCGKRKEVIEAFTTGCCYWFAHILWYRFELECREGSELVIDYVENHFATRIDGRVYDITGDVTDKYTWELWNECKDQSRKVRIILDCVVMEEAKN